MTDAFAEFLNENAQRAYPLVEDSSDLSRDLVLDFCLVTSRPIFEVRVAAVVGKLAGTVEYPSAGDGVTIIVRLATGSEYIDMPFLTSGTPLPEDISWSEFHEDYLPLQTFRTSARLCVGAGVLQIGDNDLITPQDAVFEPCTHVSLFKNQVDHVKVVHRSGPDDIVGGDVVAFGGYNLDIQENDGVMTLIPSLGGGTLGRFSGQVLDGEEVCSGSLFTINAVSPGEGDDFIIEGGKGIEVENLPDEHKIRLKVAPSKLGATIC